MNITAVRALLLISLLFTTCSSVAQSTRPNIIYILVDDMGYGDVSCLNKNSRLHTTNIDKIAAGGTRFTDAHSNSAVCTPTRYGILTGRYAWRTSLQNGVLWSYDTPLIKKGRTTVASVLKQKGYETACIGKWHLGLGWQKDADGKVDFSKEITEGPNQNGFDYFYGITASLDIPPYFYIKNNKITATSIDSIEGNGGKGFWRPGPIGNDFKHEEVLPHLTNKAVEYIKDQAKSNKPFFLYFPLPSPHTPILPTKEYLGKSGTNEYGDFVLMTDDMIGKILAAVNEAGIEQNTMIIFASDNGVSPSADLKELAVKGHNPSYIFRGAKADIFEGGHRIPFIVKWPGFIKPNTESNATICLTDFTGTIADILQVKLGDHEAEDSYSMLPLFQQKGGYKRTSIIHHSIDGNFSIRKDQWKLVFGAGSGGWSAPTTKQAKQSQLPPLQLYNLQTDIGETKNVAAAHPRVVEELSKLVKQTVENGRSTKGAAQKNDALANYLKD